MEVLDPVEWSHGSKSHKRTHP